MNVVIQRKGAATVLSSYLLFTPHNIWKQSTGDEAS